MDLTPGPPRQAPAEIIMLQLPQGLSFGHLLDISGRAADRLDAEGWLLTEERREEIRAAAYRAGREDAAKAVEAVLADATVTYSLNNANDPEARAGRKTIEILTPMMTETEAIRAALYPESA